MLTRAYFAKNDFNNAAAQCKRLLQRLPAPASGSVRCLAPIIYETIMMHLHWALVEAYDSASETDKAIEAGERFIQAFPDAPGAYARLARLHVREMKYQAAYGYLLKEYERNPSFGEDPNVYLALAFGGIAGPDRLSEALSKYRSSNPAEFALMRSLVLNHWPEFAKLSEESQADWVAASWLLFTQALGGGPAQSWAVSAGHRFGLALERELIARVFKPFSEAAPEDLHVGQLSPGNMCEGLRRPPERFAEWLDTNKPRLRKELWRVDTHRIVVLRNRSDHASPQPITKAEAEEMAKRRREFLSLVLA